MNERPRIKIELSRLDKIMEITGWSAIILLWSLIIFNYGHLPNQIPIHFNSAGAVNGYGDKSMLFVTASIDTFLFGGLTILNRYPHIFNYPLKINESNAMQKYRSATRMIRCIKGIIAIAACLTTAENITIAAGKKERLEIWLLPFITCLLITPVIYYMIKLLRDRM